MGHCLPYRPYNSHSPKKPSHTASYLRSFREKNESSVQPIDLHRSSPLQLSLYFEVKVLSSKVIQNLWFGREFWSIFHILWHDPQYYWNERWGIWLWPKDGLKIKGTSNEVKLILKVCKPTSYRVRKYIKVKAVFKLSFLVASCYWKVSLKPRCPLKKSNSLKEKIPLPVTCVSVKQSEIIHRRIWYNYIRSNFNYCFVGKHTINVIAQKSTIQVLEG